MDRLQRGLVVVCRMFLIAFIVVFTVENVNFLYWHLDSGVFKPATTLGSRLVHNVPGTLQFLFLLPFQLIGGLLRNLQSPIFFLGGIISGIARYLFSWTPTGWISSWILRFLLHPSDFIFLLGLAFHLVLGYGCLYTMAMHGEHSTVSFELLFHTLGSSALLCAFFLRMLSYFSLPSNELFGPGLWRGAFIWVTFFLSAYELASFASSARRAIREAYNSFDVLQTHLRQTESKFCKFQRYTRLSRFLYWLARGVFAVLSPFVSLYGADTDERKEVETKVLTGLKGRLGRKVMARYGLGLLEVQPKIDELRSSQWLP
ncbi:hypothetical protein GGR54DRAFT_360924 [Hypoxylon sp. NC1633]|nr:hypothetical protein GGR54DRAFT_360924 [Hypoxylon sp. NC1633]